MIWRLGFRNKNKISISSLPYSPKSFYLRSNPPSFWRVCQTSKFEMHISTNFSFESEVRSIDVRSIYVHSIENPRLNRRNFACITWLMFNIISTESRDFPWFLNKFITWLFKILYSDWFTSGPWKPKAGPWSVFSVSGPVSQLSFIWWEISLWKKKLYIYFPI